MTTPLSRITQFAKNTVDERRRSTQPPSVESGPSTVRVGVVGSGYIAVSYHIPILSSLPGTEVVFTADLDAENAASAAEGCGATPIHITDPNDLSVIPDCDVVLIAVPVGVREPYIREFSRRGTPILSEKPFAVDYDTHERFLSMTDVVTANYAWANFSSTRQMRALVETLPFGPLQEVTLAHGKVGGSTLKGSDHYQTDVALSGGGILMEIGCHMLSQLAFVFGDWDLDVDAARVEYQDDLDIDVESYLTARDGETTVPIRFDISTVRNVASGARFRFEHAEVRFGLQPDAQLSVHSLDGETLFAIEHDDEWATTLSQAMYIRWEQFLEELHTGDRPREDLGSAPTVTRLITDIYRTAREEVVA